MGSDNISGGIPNPLLKRLRNTTSMKRIMNTISRFREIMDGEQISEGRERSTEKLLPVRVGDNNGRDR